MSNIFEQKINTIGSKGTGGNKTDIPEDIYEAVCIGIADAGESTSEYQGKSKTRRNVVLVWALDHVNGFGTQSIVTDMLNPHNNEKSNWVKNFTAPAKLKIDQLSELIGKSVRLEIVKGDAGYPVVARYFVTKAPTAISEGLYLPTWLYTKGYPLMRHSEVLEGARPVTPKTDKVVDNQAVRDAVAVPVFTIPKKEDGTPDFAQSKEIAQNLPF